MKLGRFIKTPAERKRYALDYSEWLDTGETVTGVTFSITPISTISPLVVDASSISGTGAEVVYFVNHGTDGVTYTLDVIITTSGGQTKEDQVLFSVKEP